MKELCVVRQLKKVVARGGEQTRVLSI
jgi:hypothetical protein